MVFQNNLTEARTLRREGMETGQQPAFRRRCRWIQADQGRVSDRRWRRGQGSLRVLPKGRAPNLLP